MTGRIEATLNDIRRSIEEHVKRWMMVNYIETLTHLPKQVFQAELQRQAMEVMVNSLPEDVAGNLDNFLKGNTDTKGNPLKYESFGLAKRITASAVERLRDRVNDTLASKLIEEINEILVGYGVIVTDAEVRDLAIEFSEHLCCGHPKIREVLIARYVASKDVNFINRCMSRFRISDMPVEWVRTLRKMVNYFSAASAKCGDEDNSHLLQFLGCDPTRIVVIGSLLCSAEMKGVKLPPIVTLIQQAGQLSFTSDYVKSDGTIDADTIWTVYIQAFHPEQVKPHMSPLSTLLNHPRPGSVSKYDQATVIRIGNQISQKLAESALNSDTMAVQAMMQRVMQLGVTCARGVEKVIQAFASQTLTKPQRRVLAIEAVLWEMSKGVRSLSQPAEIAYLASSMERVLQAIPLDDLTDAKVIQAYNQVTGERQDTDYSGIQSLEDSKAVPPKVQLLELEENFYRSVRNDDEVVVSREYGVHPVSGMPMQGTWVLRNYHTGAFVDSDKYLNDLIERQNLSIPDHA